MGIYINPEGETKEAFLLREGVLVTSSDPETIIERCPKDCVPIVWMNNGEFTAAGVAFDPQELREFLGPLDLRPKVVYYLAIDKAAKVSSPTLAKWVNGY